MRVIIYTPNRITLVFAMECSGIGNGREVLTDLFGVNITALELDPF
jgi:hypothetical protein